MRISTEKQKQASRENGALSRGPITEQGKRRVSRNALRHGLFARTIVLDNERKQNFTRLARQYRQYFHPKNALEEGLVEELAAAFWRMRRLWAMETRMLNDKMPDDSNPDLGLSPAAPDSDEYVDEMNRLTSSFKTLADTPEFRLVLQHEGRLHRTFQRALRGLILLRQQSKNEN